MKHLLILFTCLAACLTSEAGQPADDDQLLEVLKEGHRNSLAAIQSIYCKYDLTTTTDEGKIIRRAEWWQQGSDIRWSVVEQTIPKSPADLQRKPVQTMMPASFKIITDGYNSNNELALFHSQYNNNQNLMKGVRISPAKPNYDPGVIDLWTQVLVSVVERPPMTLADLLERRESVQAVRTIKLDRQLAYEIDLVSPAKRRLSVTVMPRYNYLVKKLVVHGLPENRGLRYEGEVVTFRECRPTIFFPMEIRSGFYRPGSQTSQISTVCRMNTVQINDVLPPETFRYTIPPGMSVIDDRNGTSFIMGEGGKPKGTPIPAPQVPEKPVTYDVRTGLPVPEPDRYGNVLLVLGMAGTVGLLLVLAGRWYYVGKRGRHPDR